MHKHKPCKNCEALRNELEQIRNDFILTGYVIGRMSGMNAALNQENQLLRSMVDGTRPAEQQPVPTGTDQEAQA